MQDAPKDFEYKNWQKGIADSPEDGFANITCCNIERYPNAIAPGYQTVKTNSTPVFLTIVSSTSTVITGGTQTTSGANSLFTFTANGTLGVTAPVLAGGSFLLNFI